MALSPLDASRVWVARRGRDLVNASLRGLRGAMFLRTEPPENPSRIVVHHVGTVGDSVVSLPAMTALREHYPSAHITLVTSGGPNMPGAKELMTGVSFLDKLVRYEHSDLSSVRGARRLLDTFRSLKPELLIILTGPLTPVRSLYRNLAFAKASGAEFVVGLELSLLPVWLKPQAHAMGLSEHETERYLKLLRPLGVPQRPVRFEFPRPPAAEQVRIDELVRAKGRFVAICPCGKQEGHLWPLDRFAAIGRRIGAETGLHIVTVGGPRDRATCDRLLGEIGGGTNLAGELSLPGTAELLGNATFMLTNDTGPMHIAAAVGTPTVAIFATRDFPGRWYPYGEGHEVMRAKLVCDECLFAPQLTNHCVGKITVDQVWSACLRVLNRRGIAAGAS